MANERMNLMNMAKLSIKGLIESALNLGRTLDSDYAPLQQFFVVMEHCLKHGLKGNLPWEESSRAVGHSIGARKSNLVSGSGLVFSSRLKRAGCLLWSQVTWQKEENVCWRCNSAGEKFSCWCCLSLVITALQMWLKYDEVILGIKSAPQQDHNSTFFFFFLHVFTVQRGNGPLAGSGAVVLRSFLSSSKIEDLGCVQLLSCKLLFKMAGRAYIHIYNTESQLKLPGIMLLHLPPVLDSSLGWKAGDVKLPLSACMYILQCCFISWVQHYALMKRFLCWVR